jgi:probable rRNA maturation factor
MIHVEVQNPYELTTIPQEQQFCAWAQAACDVDQVSVVIRVVDAAESAQFNQQFRGKAGPTNVLSFPYDPAPGLPADYLGDLLICASLVEQEAQEQGKTSTAHWAHLVVHGMLHLQGFDHQNEAEAELMENREIAILHGLGYSNPYEEITA